MAKRFLVIEKGAGVRLRGKLRDPGPVLDGIGAYLTSQAQKAFREQGRGGERWPARMTPNVPGIVRDLNRGATVPSRRFTGRPALTDTGRLRQSISWRVRGKREVIVGSALPYAEIQQRGGVQRVTLTPTGRRNLYDFLKDRPEQRGALGWLFSRPTFDIQVRPRPFLAVTSQDQEAIRLLVSDYITDRGS